MKLIDKDAVIAEIERRVEAIRKAFNEPSILSVVNRTYGVDRTYANAQSDAFKSLLTFLDTLEVKEVDLDESARHYLLHEHISPLNEVLHQADLKAEMQYHKDIEDAYKAGFELGLNAKKGE